MARRILVCGGRDFWKPEVVYAALDALHAAEPVSMVIHGNARGADSLGGIWAQRRRIQCVPVPAEWSRWGRRAGGIRNQSMLGHAPSLVVAFPGGAGTADMVRRARKAGVEVFEPCAPVQSSAEPEVVGAEGDHATAETRAAINLPHPPRSESE